jgi:hypothetical protein
MVACLVRQLVAYSVDRLVVRLVHNWVFLLAALKVVAMADAMEYLRVER